MARRAKCGRASCNGRQCCAAAEAADRSRRPEREGRTEAHRARARRIEKRRLPGTTAGAIQEVAFELYRAITFGLYPRTDGRYRRSPPQACVGSHSSTRVPQCSQQRTWAENDGRSPSTAVSPGSHRLFIRSEAPSPIDGCPILRCFSRRVGKPTVSVKCAGIPVSHPSQRARRMGHPNSRLGRPTPTYTLGGNSHAGTGRSATGKSRPLTRSYK